MMLKCEEFRVFPWSLKRWIFSEKSALCIRANNSIRPMQSGILPLIGAYALFVFRLLALVLFTAEPNLLIFISQDVTICFDTIQGA